MAGTLRLVNTGGSNGQTTVTAAGTADRTINLPDEGGTLLINSGTTEHVLPSGTVGSPGLAIVDDLDTGIYSPAANTIAITTSGTQRLRIDSSGNVGIGTSDPGSYLSGSNQLVVGSASTGAGISIFTPDSSAGSLTFAEGTGAANNARGSIKYFHNATGANGYMQFAVNTAPQMTITTTGVGVGTSSPNFNLSVKGSADSLVEVQSSSNNRIIIEANTAGNNRIYARNGSNGNGTLEFRTGTSTETMRIDTSGRLLVGTTSTFGPFPGGLFVNDSIGLTCQFGRFTNDVNSGHIGLFSGRGGNPGTRGIVANDDYLGIIDFYGDDGTDLGSAGARIAAYVDGTPGANDMPGRLVFSTNAGSPDTSPTERMRIDSSGRVRTGGTTSTLSGNGWYLEENGQANYRTATTGNAYVFRSGTSTVGSISVTTTNTAYNTSSDYRLKENITPVTDGITRLQQLQPSRFNFIADPDKTVDGFIAHEVQSIVPEAITGAKDEVDEDGNPVMQGIDQSKLVPLLTAALQEAVAKIESLEARLTAAGL